MTAPAKRRDFLTAAKAIGRFLCKSAVWDEARERCNWLGRTDIEMPGGMGLSLGTIAIYTYLAGGSAGIALFLGELAARTADSETRDTALGAMHRTLAYTRAKDPLGHPFSFLTGHLGHAFVLLRLEALGIIDDAAADVAWCMDRLEQAFEAPHPLDYMGGTAGVIPCLLHHRDRLGGDRALRLAEHCGEEIVAAAGREDGLAGWDATRAVGREMRCPPLTGLSHGASGMALALFELYAATGGEQWLVLGREAFAYEDRLYSAARGNWLDVRSPYSIQEAEPQGTFQIAWCHGAPGIALARLRAAEIDAERAADHRAKAERALEVTVAGIAERLDRPRFDASLCHGIGGLSEILLIASELTTDERWRSASEEITAEIIRRYGRTGDWPGGTSTGDPNPAFLLGTTGIGHHCLRLADSKATPPILLLRRSNGEVVPRGGIEPPTP